METSFDEGQARRRTRPSLPYPPLSTCLEVSIDVIDLHHVWETKEALRPSMKRCSKQSMSRRSR